MDRAEIERLLRRVGYYLAQRHLTGEILLLGGAYMTLVLRARQATKDVDAYFVAHPAAIREAATRIASEEGLPADWLNDAAKGFLYTQPEVSTWLECPGLRVYAPDPSFIFAMKAVAGRPEDIRDLQTLRVRLRLRSAAEALEVIRRYVPDRVLPPRVQYLVEDLFDEPDD